MGNSKKAQGIIINSRYTVVEPLGGGAQGRVYKVLDKLVPDREMALKILNVGAPGSLLRFEFEQLAKLDHPHLVKVFDLGFVAEVTGEDAPAIGSAFFTQELVPGEPAHKWINRFKKNERAKKTAEVGVAVARALGLLHARGLLHRDVKPSNILVGESGNPVKLIDLGLSRVAAVWDGFKAGTLGYLPPEALSGYPDERSDLFALGATLIELATGKPLKAGAPLPESRPAHVSEKLWKVFMRLVVERPDRRYQSAKETVLALARAQGSEILGPGRAMELIDAASETENEVTRAAEARSAELIGRAKELSIIEEWFLSAAEKKQAKIGLAVLAGPPGVGKTRLFKTAAIKAQLDAAKEGTAPPSLHQGSLRELMKSFKASAEAGGGPVLDAWLSGKEFGDNSGWVDARLDNLVGEMVSSLTGVGHPMAVLIEDGDNPLVLEIFKLICQSSVEGELPLLCAAEMRDESLAEKARRLQGVLTLEVRPLDAEAEKELVKSVLGSEPDKSFVGELRGVTGGVPLLTEAVLQALTSKRKGKKLDRKALESLNLRGDPGGVVLVGLLAGIDRRTRGFVEAMAVIGSPASIEEISKVAGMEDQSLAAGVAALLDRRGWLVRHPDERLSLPYFVSKSLLASLGQKRAAVFHKRAFEALSARDGIEPSALARHAASAGMNDEARELAAKAAKSLKSAGDLNGAVEQLELELSLGNVEDADRTKTELAKLQRQTGDYRRAIELAEEVEAGGGEWAARASLERAAALRLSGRLDAALEVLEELIASPIRDVALEARAIAARMEMDRGELKRATKILGEVEIKPDAALVRSGLLSAAGLAALSMGDWAKAEASFEAGLKAAEEMENSRHRARFHGLKGMLQHSLGDWKEALLSFGAALELADSSGDRHGAATYAVNLAAAHTELDEIGEALSCYRDGIERLRQVGRPMELAQAEANWAELLLRVGDTESADAASTRAVENTGATGGGAAAFALRVRGDVLMAMGRNERARQALIEAEEIAVKAQAARETVACRQLLAELATTLESADEAGEWLEKAEQAGAGASSSSATEQRRLELELAQLRGEDTEEALDKLFEALPSKKNERRAWQLKSFAAAARGAAGQGENDRAGLAARGALDLIKSLEKATPSLHRQSETPLVREMESIRASALGVSGEWSSSSRASTDDWRRLARINTRLNSELRVGRLLELIMDTAIDLTGSERGFLLIVDKDEELKVRCARNIDNENLIEDEQSFSRSVAVRAFNSGEPVLTTDAQEDERFQSMLSVVDLHLRYIAAVPLQVKGRTIGAIYVDSRGGGRFGEERMALLRALADQAAIALTNARLATENRRRQRKIEKLNKELALKLKSNRGELDKVRGELERRTEDLIGKYSYEGMVARSETMAEVFRLLDRVMDSDLPVVVEGESGTGKELVARALHFNGLRSRKPFVAENCAAIPETLLESVLFGHVKGAFTGAVKDSRGLFVEADGGTLFLDEVASMPPAMQVKLLRVLQDGEVRPVGGTKTTKVDVRIVVASNADLKEMVKNKAFREDLYYRLSVIRVKLPPLRSRKEDIPLLAEHFCRKHGGDNPPQIAKETLEALLDYPWPGNVRQLENEMMRAIVLSGGKVELNHLSEEIIQGVSQLSDLSADLNVNRQVERVKRRLVSLALKRTGGNQTAAAELLGLSRYGLQKMLARFES